jgi:fluoroacetyl-CoA thioesterase
MKASLTPGISKTVRIIIDPDHAIDFMGDECRVYATPKMVNDIEVICRELLMEHLDAGEDSVGSRIEVDHRAPTVLGMWAEVTATVAEVKGRAVTLDISARDALEHVASGKHTRVVVDVKTTAERLKRKAAKFNELAPDAKAP